MVTSLADTGAGTLRNALQLANATGDADTIAFDNALSGTINLGAANGALPVTSPVSIQGLGASTLTVDANATVADKFRVFEISDAANDVSISGLTLTGGLVDDAGGAILFRSAETLTIVDSVISGNQASSGGGIYSEYEGTVSVNSSTISGNTAESSHGGGIHNVDGDISLTDSIVSGNYSYSDGAGIFSQYAGNITVTDSHIINNKVTEAGYHGGGIYGANGDVTITGSTISGNDSKGDGGGLYSYKGTVSIANTTITGNTADYSGGGVFNYDGDLTITSSLISSNTADYGTGGGVGNEAGSLTISGSRITGNHAVSDGGGVANNTGMVRVLDSLLDGNSTTADGAGIASAIGAVIVTNSTITGNSATVGGGGIQADVAPVRLVHTTLVLNTAGASGGGIGVVDDTTGESILIYNSIVADNTATTGPDLFVPGDPGTVLDIQSSLISDNSDSTLVASPGDANGNVIGSAASPADAMLSALAHNGGTTNTHDINSSSPAINSANAALSLDFGPDGIVGTGDDLTLVADQRGGLYDRSIGLGADMGALEKQARPTLVVDTTADVVNGDFSPGDRSLREMLALANGDLGDDVISFSLSLPATITLDPMLGSLVVDDNLSVLGPGADQLTIQNASATAFRIFDIAATTAEATFSGVTLQGGDAGAGDGGAIRSAASAQLQLQNVGLIDNSAANGGALAVSSGQVEIHDATITGNAASSEGGALALLGSQCEIFHSTIAGNNAAADGGAIMAGSGQVAIISSTIANNTSGANGGAVAVTAATASLTTLNSTLSGNTATTAGGGVYSENAAVTLTTSTLTLNTASSGGGIGFLADGNGEELHLSNTIVADNTAGTAPDFLAPGSLGPLTFSVVYSLIGNNSGTSLTESTFSGGQPVPDADGNLIGGGTSPLVDPQLSPLADNGGPTQTHALVETSPAVDTGAHAAQLPQDEYDLDGDGNTTEFLSVDQRGDFAVRVVNVRSDIGAFELPPAAVINWSNPADIVYGTALGVTQLNASTSSGFGSFVYDPAAGTVLQAGGNQTLTTTFTPNELRQYRVTTATVEINVVKADPVLNWSDPADIVYQTALGTTQLNATVVGSLAGSFAYTPDHGTVLDAGENQNLNVTFTPTDTANFNEATAQVQITVLKATPVLTWNDPADIPYGTLLDGTQLNATVVDDVPGIFAYTPDAGTLLDVGIDQQLDVLFTPTDDDNYNTANASVEIDVVKADPVLSWSDPSAITYGTALDGTQLNATVNGGLPGTFDYTPASGVVLGAGVDQALNVVFSPTDTVRYNQAAANVEIDVLKADPAITWNDPAAIPHGTLLSGTQLDATADVPGTFVYAPDVGVQLGVGDNQPLSVVFTPDETANYNSAGDSVTIDVLPNQAPSFVASDPASVLEDAGPQTVPGFISSFDPGSGESALQSVLTYHVSNVGYPALFTTLPSVTTAGVLTYEIAANVFGEATFEVAVQDDGGVEGGGVDMSAAQTFTITIQGVNDAPSFSLGSEVQVLEDSGAQTVVGFASGFAPGQYEDGTWPGSQVMHDEGADGTSDPLSTDNLNPTPLGATQPGSNLVSGYVEEAFSVGDMDVFTFTVETGFQWSGLYVDAYEYPNGAMGDNAAFLGINNDTFFPYNADDFENDPTVDYNAFLGGTVFGTSDLGGGSILSRAGAITGSGFIGPLGAGTYTIYIQQTGPATRYTLDIEVTSVASQSLSSHEVSNVSIPSLFSAGPAIGANGDLTFTPAADTFGTATFQVRVLDDGGTDNGGVDASGFLTGTITVQEVVLDRDYGDAPSPYAVLSIDGGASHLVGTLMLGSSVDVEADGQPSVNADGDGADEDGVTELASVIAVSGVATTSSFSIVASESGRLDAWIDFDQNGIWTDSGEQVATNLAVNSGDNTLSYVIPAGTAPGTKVARFRLSTVGGLAPTGDANDGEVEDDLLIVSDGGVPSAASVQPNAPTTTIAIVGGVLTVDNGSTDLFSSPVTAIDQLTVNGRTGDDEVSLAFEVGPANGMLIDGAAGDNSLFVSGSLVDFTTAGSVAASNFQTLDMTAVEESEIRLDATSVAALSPVSKTVRVNGSQGDRLVLTDPDEWRMQMPVVDDGHFLRVAVNQATSEQVQVDIPSSGWQNLVESSDVDANGMTSVFDALLIITEVGRNSFSDAITLALDDPLSVGAWPGVYFDVNEDGKVTTLDALQILNSLAVIGGGEGEASGSHASRDLTTGRALSNIPSQDRLGLAAGLQSNAHRSETVAGEFCLPTKLASAQSLTLTHAEVSTRLGIESVTRDNPMGPEWWADRVDELLSDREVSDRWL